MLVIVVALREQEYYFQMAYGMEKFKNYCARVLLL